MTLLAELQRRKVFKVGAAYLVVAWLAVQAVSIAFPAFDAPPWALRVFILLSLLGFPLALVMAWIFDATPDGVKFDPGVSGSKRVFAVDGTSYSVPNTTGTHDDKSATFSGKTTDGGIEATGTVTC